MARILVIDDEIGICEEFSQVLKGENHEVDTALNGLEGLEKIHSQEYDIIFLDVLMPKMEGREALEAIKKITPTPVVIMSGYLPPNREQEIIRAGAMASLKKPLDLYRVFELIEKALELKNKR